MKDPAMNAKISPLQCPVTEYTLQARNLIGLLFGASSTRREIAQAFRVLLSRLSGLAISEELYEETHARLRWVQRVLRRNCVTPTLRQRAAVRVIRLTLPVIS